MTTKNKTLCIVPCGKAKIWDRDPEAGPTQSKFVYTGSFAGKSAEYAQLAYPDSWVILSAKYGFLFPDDIISDSYNISFNNKKTNPIKIKELKKQKIEKELYYDRIVILGGKEYVKMAKECFRQAEIITPLAGCKGIGYMLQKLNKMIKEYKYMSKHAESDEKFTRCLKICATEIYTMRFRHEPIGEFCLDFEFEDDEYRVDFMTCDHGESSFKTIVVPVEYMYDEVYRGNYALQLADKLRRFGIN